jgi:hypothetical protein
MSLARRSIFFLLAARSASAHGDKDQRPPVLKLILGRRRLDPGLVLAYLVAPRFPPRQRL